MSSCHELIVDARSLSYYDRMMKKELEKETMEEDLITLKTPYV